MALVALRTKKASARFGSCGQVHRDADLGEHALQHLAELDERRLHRDHGVEREAVGQPGLGEQLARQLRVVRRRLPEVVHVVRRAGGDPLRRQRAVAEEEGVDDRLAVDGVGHRPAHRAGRRTRSSSGRAGSGTAGSCR